MNFAPQRNWDLYNKTIAEHECQRGDTQTPEQKFAIYADLFNLIHQATSDHNRNSVWEEQRLEKKLAFRRKMVHACLHLNQ